MPLSAYIDGEYVYGPSLSDESWAALRQARTRAVTLPCGRPGFPRISPRGTKHFVHRSNHDGCFWAHESADHVDAKRTIVDALRDSGWTVRTEQCGDDWRADVLATAPDGPRRVAFEVQLSPQTFEETVDRQRRYVKAGVQGVWLFRNAPFRSYDEQLAAMPMFTLARDEHEQWRVQVRRHAARHGYAAWVDERPAGAPGTMALAAFVRGWLRSTACLRGMLRLTDRWPSRIDIVRAACPECQQANLLHFVRTPRVSACGVAVTEQSIPPIYETAEIAHLRAYGPFGVRTMERVAAIFQSEPTLRATGERERARIVVREADGATRFLCRSCPHIFERPEYEDLAEGGEIVVSADQPVPNPRALNRPDFFGAQDESMVHWCLAPIGAECPERSRPMTPDNHRRLDDYFARRQARRDAWPESLIAAAVKSRCEAQGWRSTRAQLMAGGTRYWFSKGGQSLLTHIGNDQWTEDGIRQVYADADERRLHLLWFTEHPHAMDTPELHRRPIIPIRAARYSQSGGDLFTPSGWDFFVVAGPGEEMPLSRALPILLDTLCRNGSVGLSKA